MPAVLADYQQLIGGHIVDGVGATIGPGDFYAVYLFLIFQSYPLRHYIDLQYVVLMYLLHFLTLLMLLMIDFGQNALHI